MGGPRKRILVIEDDLSLCELLKKIMERFYDVEALTSSVDAWERLSSGSLPHLIITDFKMPHVDGLELIESIRTSGLYQEIPIIIITGSGDPEFERKCKKWEVTSIIFKPFNPDSLLETIDKTIKLRNHVQNYRTD